jgi:hypothetical protein
VGLRLFAVWRLLPHIDEPASLLATKMVAERGYPLYPSHVLYLQGAVFSYLGAPLVWLFDDPFHLLRAERLLNLAITVMIVPLSMKFVRYLTGSLAAALLAGLLVACDPNLIFWSAAIRPYGLLSLETLAVLYCFAKLVIEGATVRIGPVRVVTILPILCALGVFTHIGFCFLIAPLAIAAVLIWKRSLLGANRAILISAAISLLPLPVFLLLGRVVGIGNGTGSSGIGESFVGSHLLRKARFTSPDFQVWTENFSLIRVRFPEILPLAIELLSLVLLVLVLARWRRSGAPRDRVIVTVLLAHWGIIAIAAIVLSAEPAGRYVTQVLALGSIVLTLACWVLWNSARRPETQRLARVAAIAIAILLIGQSVLNASWRIDYPGADPNYLATTQWTAQQLQPGQIVIIAVPPAAEFGFSTATLDNDMYFLAGPADGPRTRRYIKTMPDGEPGDYWLGLPPIASLITLCSVLKDHANNGWILVDRQRLRAKWAYRGDFNTVIQGSTERLYQTPRGTYVLFIRPTAEWTQEARTTCGTAVGG